MEKHLDKARIGQPLGKPTTKNSEKFREGASNSQGV